MDRADIIIVGAGSAGCVLANRLSADPTLKVLVVEAGPRDGAISLRAPAAMVSNLTGTRFNWAYPGMPEPGLDGRSFQHDRGRVLGGSSSINGMCWIRGHARDYDGWAQRGCTGWGPMPMAGSVATGGAWPWRWRWVASSRRRCRARRPSRWRCR